MAGTEINRSCFGPLIPVFSYTPPMTNHYSLILASASPRRSELLRAAGIEFTVRIADIDETVLPEELPGDYVLRLSREKAQAVAEPGDLVLGADTTVVISGEIAGKPIDAEDARRMLRLLSGQWHEVLTGVSLVRGEQVLSEVAVTRVKFAELNEAEIDWYVSTGEAMDKAGAYGIQGYASRFVESVEGNYSNVVGLPVPMVYQMLIGMRDEG
jgi:septum formation protein